MEAQIWISTSKQFYVKVVASNGLTLAHSETYTTKQSAKNCADIIAGGGKTVDKTA